MTQSAEKDRAELDRLLLEFVTYNPETGEITWAKKPNRNIEIGSQVGKPNSWGHWCFSFKGTTLMTHRVAWFIYHSEWPQNQIDHINGDKSDNRICNLRDVTQDINMQNQHRAHIGNKSGLLGVSYKPYRKANPWRAMIKANGKNISLGSYSTAEAAHDAYISAKSVIHKKHFDSLEEINAKR